MNGHCYGACANDGDCDDGVFCNGEESCVNNACAAGDPVACAEGEECNTESDMCEEAQDICGAGFGCTPASPLMGLTLLALFFLRGTRQRARPVGRARRQTR
ncbi:MAG: hypothetical protein IH830_07570 [Planctomycetes bacterium]|nr:hypothetical protein [Planctomycetota bacterium]